MLLAQRRDMRNVIVALLIVVLIDHRDNLLFREVVDIRLARHVERRVLTRRIAIDLEVFLLQVHHVVFIGILVNDSTRADSTAVAVRITINIRQTGFGSTTFTHFVRLTTIIVVYAYRQSTCSKHFLLEMVTKAWLYSFIVRRIYHLSCTVVMVAHSEGFFCDVVCACRLCLHCRVVNLLVGDFLKLRP